VQVQVGVAAPLRGQCLSFLRFFYSVVMHIETIDLQFLSIEHSIAVFLIKGREGYILIECGPASTLPALDATLAERGLQRSDIRHVLLTHIHFDHAGAAWALAEAGAVIYVHPKGLQHLAAPEKLYNSARQIYGADMDRLWGPMHPIAEAHLYAPVHGEELELSGLKCKAWYTPGHAVHHIAWQVEGPDMQPAVFTGDVAGVCIEGGPVMPPCPPPDIQIEDWMQSVELLNSLPVERMFLTHFGEKRNKNEHLESLLNELTLWAEWMRPFAEKNVPQEEIIPQFTDFAESRYELFGVSAANRARYHTANPAFMSVAGLMRYWSKKLRAMLLWGCLLTACLSVPLCVEAQTKKELEEKRQKILRDIETTNRMLKKTTENKEAALDQFVTLRSQIKSRESLIQTIEDEVQAADQEIDRHQSVIAALQGDVQRLRDDYGKMLRSAYRHRVTGHPLLFLFSAQSLNQLFARWVYLRNFNRFRRQQALLLNATQEELTQKIASIRFIRDDKAALLNNMKGQKDTLGTELSNQNQMLRTLTKDEARLRTDLVRKQAAYEVLNKNIENIIQTEVKKREEAAKKTTLIKKTTPAVSEKPAVAERPAAPETPAKRPASKTETPPVAAPSPESPDTDPATESGAADAEAAASEDAPSSAFRRQRGHLPWPVRSGFISRGFGRQKHPTLKNIEITNNGIDIRTDDGAEVWAVEGGRVAGVQYIPGHNYTIVIQHGDYYTVYSNLSESQVQKGDTVKARQLLGRVSTNNITGTTELHFEVWREKERMNPAAWIKR
jgi:septal ring factor EnvC (AmiA/AmiB activator)/glyoxylase-like metal-dependent hydrolase (beta-lactamase superfamily II)